MQAFLLIIAALSPLSVFAQGSPENANQPSPRIAALRSKPSVAGHRATPRDIFSPSKIRPGFAVPVGENADSFWSIKARPQSIHSSQPSMATRPAMNSKALTQIIKDHPHAQYVMSIIDKINILTTPKITQEIQRVKKTMTAQKRPMLTILKSYLAIKTDADAINYAVMFAASEGDVDALSGIFKRYKPSKSGINGAFAMAAFYGRTSVVTFLDDYKPDGYAWSLALAGGNAYERLIQTLIDSAAPHQNLSPFIRDGMEWACAHAASMGHIAIVQKMTVGINTTKGMNDVLMGIVMSKVDGKSQFSMADALFKHPNVSPDPSTIQNAIGLARNAGNKLLVDYLVARSKNAKAASVAGNLASPRRV
jgi:hypothetical protein